MLGVPGMMAKDGVATLRRRAPLCTARPRRGQEGIALVLVLWLTVLLTVIAGGFAYSMRTEALAARNAASLAQARALADGAIMRVAFELMRPRTQNEPWQADGMVHVWNEDSTRIAVNAIDESGRIDLNTAPDALLKNLLQVAGGLDADSAARMVDVIDDWKSPGDLKRPNGAKAPEYQAAGLSYKPPNAPFESVAELQRVLGMTPALYAALVDNLTVFSKLPGINPAYASRTALLALPNATAEIVDTYLTQRQNALAARLPAPVFPLAGLGAGAVNLWRIHTEATLTDGTTFVREAVVRPGGDTLHPVTLLVWQEGERQLVAAPAGQ
ncbi:MAG TPA: type II secretion system protein GspK [Casimicrobiaceae bacterium]|jgi:general secretion pathway protein K|nr:type II secretion system protein GspK [Casimicrobiaceae bacterium]